MKMGLGRLGMGLNGVAGTSASESLWPDASTTGPTIAMTAVPGSATSGTGWSWNGGDGVIYITGNGATVNGLDVDGGIVITGDNVTLTNSRATLDENDIAGIYVGGDNAIIEDCQVIGGFGASGIEADGVGQNLIWVDSVPGATIRRCDLSGGENGIMISGLDCTFEDNYIHDLPGELFSYTTLGTNPISTTSGSPTVTVTHTAHGLDAGDLVSLDNTGTVGGFTVGDFRDTVRAIATVPNANSYTITMGGNASSTATGGTGCAELTWVPGDPHTDGVQFFGDGIAAGATLTGNNVIAPMFCTSAIIMGPNAAGTANYTVTGNRFRGGYGVFRAYLDATCTYTDNRIGGLSIIPGASLVTDNGSGTGFPTWSGNVNDDTNAAIPQFW